MLRNGKEEKKVYSGSQINGTTETKTLISLFLIATLKLVILNFTNVIFLKFNSNYLIS